MVARRLRPPDIPLSVRRPVNRCRIVRCTLWRSQAADERLVDPRPVILRPPDRSRSIVRPVDIGVRCGRACEQQDDPNDHRGQPPGPPPQLPGWAGWDRAMVTFTCRHEADQISPPPSRQVAPPIRVWPGSAAAHLVAQGTEGFWSSGWPRLKNACPRWSASASRARNLKRAATLAMVVPR